MLLDPPRKRFQIVSPKDDAWLAEVKLAAPVAPPRERVTILPLDWQVSMSEAREEQSGRFVPENTGFPEVLQIYVKT